ncbi:efflux RND transporter periplasmic adaptor subunit [bacterium]|nr:efflux RND transporter periplasmic adaptor subunit [bacterium]
MPPPPVTVATPLRKTITEWDEYTGRFEAVETVDVRARVGGYLDSIHFKEGAMVNKGDLLFIIDPRPYQTALKQAQADIAAAKARITFTAADLERGKKLIKTGAIAEKVVDERTEAKRQAEAQLQSALAAVEKAKLDLEFTRVTAPVSGRISRRYVTEGNLVTGGTADSTLLTTIVSLDPIHLYFDVDEQSYLKYVRLAHSGDRPSSRENANPVYVALADEKIFSHEGHMDFVDNQISRGTGTMRGRAVLPNPDGLLAPGMFGRVRLQGSGEYETLLVPEDVVMTDQSRKYVFVVDEKNMVKPVNVVLGPMSDGLRVIKEGLTGNERIIIRGMQRAHEGAPVTPENGTITASTDSTQAPADSTPVAQQPEAPAGDETAPPAEAAHSENADAPASAPAGEAAPATQPEPQKAPVLNVAPPVSAQAPATAPADQAEDITMPPAADAPTTKADTKAEGKSQ